MLFDDLEKSTIYLHRIRDYPVGERYKGKIIEAL